MEKEILVYTDGSSLGNPGPGGWGAILVFEKKRVRELGGFETNTTNNKMELTALARSLELLAKDGGKSDVKIFADSKYVLRGIKEWSFVWEKNGWMTKTKTEVLNRALWEEILKCKREVEQKRKIFFDYVPGHVKHSGNERADEIARGFAEGKSIKLYDGDYKNYSISIENAEIDLEELSKRKKSRSRSQAKAYSYLSFVDGVVKRHATWAECEARVKGKSGAKFKKAISQEDERKILKAWGV